MPDGDGPGELPPDTVLELVVALDTAPLHATVRQLRVLLALGWLASSLGCVSLIWWTVRRGLAPLDRLNAQMQERSGDAPGPVFELSEAPGELVPVVDQLNALMTRIAHALHREQALQSAAAHELRTPLAGLRSTLEVALNRPRTSDEWQQTAQQSLAITLEMQSLVEALLELARAASPNAVQRTETVNLSEMLNASWKARADEGAGRGLAFELDVPAALDVRTDAGLLRRVIDNLLDNAVCYADADSNITVSAATQATGLALTVDNVRADVSPEQAERAVEPFWRGDPGRGGTGRHAGLGLALCKRIAETLGGSLHVEAGDRRFAVRLELPA